MLILSIIIVIIILFFFFLYEKREEMVDGLDLEKDGVIKIRDKKEVLNHLPEGYQFIDYRYSIRGCTLSTFHRDVTSSPYVFATKYPVYTYIVYHNKGPHLSYCPYSHKTTPYLFTSPRTMIGEKGDSYLFHCDLVHAGAVNDYGDNRYVEQFKIAHRSDIGRLNHLVGIKKKKRGNCDISFLNDRCQRNLSLLFAYPINHIFTPLLQKRHESKWVRGIIKSTGIGFYNM